MRNATYFPIINKKRRKTTTDINNSDYSFGVVYRFTVYSLYIYSTPCFIRQYDTSNELAPFQYILFTIKNVWLYTNIY